MGIGVGVSVGTVMVLVDLISIVGSIVTLGVFLGVNVGLATRMNLPAVGVLVGTGLGVLKEQPAISIANTIPMNPERCFMYPPLYPPQSLHRLLRLAKSLHSYP